MVIKLKIITLDPLEYNFHSNELLGKEMAYVLTLKFVIGVNIYGDIIDISKHAPIGGGGSRISSIYMVKLLKICLKPL